MKYYKKIGSVYYHYNGFGTVAIYGEDSISYGNLKLGEEGEDCTREEVEAAFSNVVSNLKKKLITVNLNENTPTEVLENL